MSMLKSKFDRSTDFEMRFENIDTVIIKSIFKDLLS